MSKFFLTPEERIANSASKPLFSDPTKAFLPGDVITRHGGNTHPVADQAAWDRFAAGPARTGLSRLLRGSNLKNLPPVDYTAVDPTSFPTHPDTSPTQPPSMPAAAEIPHEDQVLVSAQIGAAPEVASQEPQHYQGH